MGILENHPALVLSAIHDFVGLLNPGFGYISATPTLYIYIFEIYIYFILGGSGLVSSDCQNVSGIY